MDTMNKKSLPARAAENSANLSESPGLSHIATGAGINFVGGFSRAMLGFAFTLLISRVLTLEQLGFYTLGSTIVLLLLYFCVLGMDTGLWRYVAAFNAQEDAAGVRGTIRGSLYISLPLSIAVTILLLTLAGPIATHVFNDPDFANPLRAFAVTIPLLAAARLFNSATQGLQHMKYTAVRDFLEQGLRLVLTAALFLAGLRLGGALLANAAAIVMVAVLSFIFLERVAPIISHKAESTMKLRQLLMFSLPMGASLILSHLLLWNDTLLLGYFRTSDEVGLYSVAVRLITVAAIMLNSFNTMFAPVISDLHVRGMSAELEQLFKRVTRWIVTLSLPIFLPLLLFGPQVLLIFGEKFTVVSVSLAVLTLGQLVNVATGPVGGMICMCGRPKLETLNSVFAWILSIGLCVLLIPRYGILGAAIANASANILANIVRAVEVQALFGVHAYNAEYFKPAAAGLIAGGISFAGLKLDIAGEGLVALGIWAAVFLIIFAGMIYFFGIEKKDAEMTQVLKTRLFRSRPA